MKLRYFLMSLLMVLFMASCGSKKRASSSSRERARVYNRKEHNAHTPAETTGTPNRSYTSTVEAYVQRYAPIAQEEMRLYHIPASITLAQGILESGAGQGDLTRRANNHFGIKCHDWEGAKVYHDDDRRQECFRKYQDPKYSFRDHSLFLAERRRYASLFDLDISDYQGWAHGLRKLGYATDRRYPDKLIDLIERYQLYRYDTGQVSNYSPQEVAISQDRQIPSAQNNSRIYTVSKGDTLYSLSKRFGVSVSQLKADNNLKNNTISIGQRLTIQAN